MCSLTIDCVLIGLNTGVLRRAARTSGGGRVPAQALPAGVQTYLQELHSMFHVHVHVEYDIDGMGRRHTQPHTHTNTHTYTRTYTNTHTYTPKCTLNTTLIYALEYALNPCALC